MLPRETWHALKVRRTGLAGLAGCAARVIYAFLLCDRARSMLLVAFEGVIWRLDAKGFVDYSVPEFDERRLGASSEYLGDILPQEALHTGDRWRPSTDIRQAITRDIWPDGEPEVHPAPPPRLAEGQVALHQALAAVGQADVARSATQLADQLALSSHARAQLLQALRIDPRALEDLIAAESVPDGRLH